jgi:hypothetical protein
MSIKRIKSNSASQPLFCKKKTQKASNLLHSL